MQSGVGFNGRVYTGSRDRINRSRHLERDCTTGIACPIGRSAKCLRSLIWRGSEHGHWRSMPRNAMCGYGEPDGSDKSSGGGRSFFIGMFGKERLGGLCRTMVPYW